MPTGSSAAWLGASVSGQVGYGDVAQRERAPLEKRFESYDWLKAIGSMVFLVAAILPWWTREYTGFELRRTGFGDWLGIIAAIAILAVGLLTVIVETESLPIPRWVLNPTWMLRTGHRRRRAASACASSSTPSVQVTRGSVMLEGSACTWPVPARSSCSSGA